MHHGGTLKKRRKRRNIAKVTGLSAIPYDEKTDLYDGKGGFFEVASEVKANLQKNKRDNPAIVSISQLLMRNRNRDGLSSRKRVTREPTFHLVDAQSFTESSKVAEVSHQKFHGEKAPESVSTDPWTETAELPCLDSSLCDRPYLLDKTTMSRLKQILLLAVCSGTVPWTFNSKTHQIDRWRPSLEKLWKIQWFIITIQTCFLTLFQFYSFTSRVNSNALKTYREVFMNSVSVYWYVCAIYFNVNMYFYKDQIREYINTLFKFNREFKDKYVLSLDDYDDGGRVVMNLSIPSNTAQVFVSVSLFLVIPHEPWYIFSYIHPKPWYWLIPGAIQEFIVVGQVISNYVLYQWIMVAHTNSVEFWLKEIHNNNDSGYTSPVIRHPTNSIAMYRSLQVLCVSFNASMSLAIPLLKTHIVTGLIPCGYVFIRSMNKKFIEEFPGILTYPICVIDCATAGFTTLSLAAEVYDLASGFVESWSRTKQKDLRRVLMSCAALKVWVGRVEALSTHLQAIKIMLDLPLTVFGIMIKIITFNIYPIFPRLL